jgi:hypothetical protein
MFRGVNSGRIRKTSFARGVVICNSKGIEGQSENASIVDKISRRDVGQMPCFVV